MKTSLRQESSSSSSCQDNLKVAELSLSSSLSSDEAEILKAKAEYKKEMQRRKDEKLQEEAKAWKHSPLMPRRKKSREWKYGK